MTGHRGKAWGLFVGVLLLGGCGDDDAGEGEGEYDPVIPTAWADAVTNRYFPLLAGTRWEYSADTDEGTETNTVLVTDDTKVIQGVTATVVHDSVYLDGVLTEDTMDWYAQDDAGNVWYLGESSEEFEDGVSAGTEGSWEWGVEGALPGVVMYAEPGDHLDEEYRQEYLAGEAEDWGKVVAVGEDVDVAAGSYTDCVKTDDWNALEPGTTEHKWYCPDVGVVREDEGDGETFVDLQDLVEP